MSEGDEADALWVSNELSELQARVKALEELVLDLLAQQIAASSAMRRVTESHSRWSTVMIDERTAVQDIKFRTHYRYLELLREHVRVATERAELDEPE